MDDELIIKTILSKLDIKDVLGCKEVNKTFYRVIKSNSFIIEWSIVHGFYPNHLTSLLLLFPDEDWDLYNVSKNINITREFIFAFPERFWHIGGMRKNPNFSGDDWLNGDWNPYPPWVPQIYQVREIVFDEDCDWEEQLWTIAQKEATKHHKKTGHQVNIEVGYVKIYQRSSQNPKEVSK